MLVTMLKSKIHRATVTQADLNYVGSITIDANLLARAGIAQYEQVMVVNNNNGARLTTYAIAGEADSGVVCLNGAAARMAAPGDVVIILSFGQMTQQEAADFTPTQILVDEKNRFQRNIYLEKPLSTLD